MYFKKRKRSKIGTLACVAGVLLSAVLLQSCIQPGTDGEQTGDTGASPNTYLYQTASYEYRTEVDEAVLITEMDATYLLLANKTCSLGEDYIPSDLVKLECATNPANGGRSETLDSRAAAALYAMLKEMQADGISDIFVTSSYRSYSYQVSLYHQYLNRECSAITSNAYAYFGEEYIRSVYLEQGKRALTREDAEKVVQSYSAYPGTSEHQTGLCVDFGTQWEYSKVGNVLTKAFENTEAFRWLSENCYRFGFILRYPEDKVSVTGYSYEPWHYRFVGREAATEIMLRGLCLEEFLSEMN